MKQIVVVSGKGGTGKTSITASFATLAKKPVICDCDVDAANLHILMNAQIEKEHKFSGGKIAVINQEKCYGCGQCKQLCKFHAVELSNEGYFISPFMCEGCGVCFRFCPNQAVVMKPADSGRWFESVSPYGPFIHAELGVSGENSGKLVTVVRKKAEKIANETGADCILIDGSPGIGCPVIASVTGTDVVIIVTEPTRPGYHDFLRIAELARQFKTQIGVIVNKFDINESIAAEIEEKTMEMNQLVLGRIPWDDDFSAVQIMGEPLVKQKDSQTSELLQKIWLKIEENYLKGDKL
ncbi:MAG: ATP-binding protein [Vulcanimicrobiota bacterium]